MVRSLFLLLLLCSTEAISVHHHITKHHTQRFVPHGRLEFNAPSRHQRAIESLLAKASSLEASDYCDGIPSDFSFAKYFGSEGKRSADGNVVGEGFVSEHSLTELDAYLDKKYEPFLFDSQSIDQLVKLLPSPDEALNLGDIIDSVLLTPEKQREVAEYLKTDAPEKIQLFMFEVAVAAVAVPIARSIQGIKANLEENAVALFQKGPEGLNFNVDMMATIMMQYAVHVAIFDAFEPVLGPYFKAFAMASTEAPALFHWNLLREMFLYPRVRPLLPSREFVLGQVKSSLKEGAKDLANDAVYELTGVDVANLQKAFRSAAAFARDPAGEAKDIAKTMVDNIGNAFSVVMEPRQLAWTTAKYGAKVLVISQLSGASLSAVALAPVTTAVATTTTLATGAASALTTGTTALTALAAANPVGLAIVVGVGVYWWWSS